MDVRSIIKQAIKESGITQKELAEKLGMKSQSAISDKIKRETMSVKAFVEMLDVMDYEIIVRKKVTDDVEIKLK